MNSILLPSLRSHYHCHCHITHYSSLHQFGPTGVICDTFTNAQGLRIQTYEYQPTCAPGEERGAVVGVHGIGGYSEGGPSTGVHLVSSADWLGGWLGDVRRYSAVAI